MASGGAVDLLHSAIWEAIDRYKVRNPVQCFEKVLILGRWWIDKLNKKDSDES